MRIDRSLRFFATDAPDGPERAQGRKWCVRDKTAPPNETPVAFRFRRREARDEAKRLNHGGMPHAIVETAE